MTSPAKYMVETVIQLTSPNPTIWLDNKDHSDWKLRQTQGLQLASRQQMKDHTARLVEYGASFLNILFN